MSNTAIEFEHVSKQYRLGLVSTKTLSHDIRRFWITNVLGKEDPYLKIGETNDRASKGNSDYVWALPRRATLTMSGRYATSTSRSSKATSSASSARTAPESLHFSNSFPASPVPPPALSVPTDV